MVIVGGNEEEHPEGAYYFQVDGKWERISESAAGAQEERNKGLARQWYQQQTGEKLPEPESKGTLLRDALDAYLSELELKVASRNRKHRTLALMKQTLNEFAQQCEVRYLQEITATHMSRYTAWTIQHSPTKSARTGRNKFLRVLQFLKYNDAVPTVGIGRAKRPLGMRDAPRVVEQEVSINTPEELKQFFAACGHRQLVTFQTFNRSGMREMELATLRRQDCHLNGTKPYLSVVGRPEYDFLPKWYQNREVSIDLELAAMLRDWLKTHNRKLVFGTVRDYVDGYLLRTCNRIAKRAGLDPKEFWLHKFRANYATWCLRRGMDMETLRKQLGHRNMESLHRYVTALEAENLATKVAGVFAVKPEDLATAMSAATPSRVM
jgi:integrase